MKRLAQIVHHRWWKKFCGVLLFFALLPAVPLSNQAACVRRGSDTAAMRIEN
jgi:hypothetical protein